MRFLLICLSFLFIGCQSQSKKLDPDLIHKEILTLDTHIDFDTTAHRYCYLYGHEC